MKLWPRVALLVMFTAPATVAAQSAVERSTSSGVYNREQANRGQDVYLGQCRSCHTPESHTGPLFQVTWNGRTLAELYAYLRERMPKNEPGTLSEQEYIDVLTYLLRLNRMPAGGAELPPDAELLKAIRFETTSLPVRKDP